jgi:hypothetical protein
MEEQEAKIILDILTGADGSCAVCAENLFEKFVAKFPEYTGLAKKIFKEEFKIELGHVEDEMRVK